MAYMHVYIEFKSIFSKKTTREDASHLILAVLPTYVGLKASSMLELPLCSNTHRLEGTGGQGMVPAIQF